MTDDHCTQVRDSIVPESRAIRIFLISGASVLVSAWTLDQFMLGGTLDFFGIIFGVLFSLVNVIVWRTVFNAMVRSAVATEHRRRSNFEIGIVISGKVLLILSTAILFISRGQSFVLGFSGALIAFCLFSSGGLIWAGTVGQGRRPNN